MQQHEKQVFHNGSALPSAGTELWRVDGISRELVSRSFWPIHHCIGDAAAAPSANAWRVAVRFEFLQNRVPVSVLRLEDFRNPGIGALGQVTEDRVISSNPGTYNVQAFGGSQPPFLLESIGGLSHRFAVIQCLMLRAKFDTVRCVMDAYTTSGNPIDLSFSFGMRLISTP